MSKVFLVCLTLVSTTFVFASSKQGMSKRDVSTKGTDISFEDLLVQGKYHFSDEAVTTVENDKVLEGLLGIRKDFKDRMQQSAELY